MGTLLGWTGLIKKAGSGQGCFVCCAIGALPGNQVPGVGVCACLLPRCSYSYRGGIHSLIGSGFRSVIDYGESGFGARHMALSHVNILGHCWGYLMVSREISLRGWLVEMRCPVRSSAVEVCKWMDTRSFVL